MAIYIIAHCLSLLALTHRLTATVLSGNETVFDEIRQPRVTGRIVKLYSGTRPDPIHCTGEGFQSDPTDCSIFYRCVNSGRGKFTVFRFQCGPGTIYDPETEVCNHPRNIKRSECSGLALHESSRQQNNENEIDSGLEQSPPSPIRSNVDFFTKLTTKIVQMSSTSDNWATNILNKSQLRTTILNRILVTTPKSNNIIDDICITDGFIGDTENCRKFYRCVANGHGGFIRYEFSCSETTLWDDDMQGCNHAWAVKRRRCGRGNEDDNFGLKNKLEILGDKEQQNLLNKTTQNLGNQVNHPIENFQPHSPVIKTTSPTVNNLTHRQSVIPSVTDKLVRVNKISHKQTYGNDYSDNEDNWNNESENHSTESSTATTSTTTSNNKPGTTCSSSGFMADPNDCKKFYRCVDNGRNSYTKYEFSCGDGTVWDSNIEACNHAWAVKDCGKNSQQSSSTTTTQRPIQSTENTSYYTTTETDKGDNDDGGYFNSQQPSASSTENTHQSTDQSESISDTTCIKSGFIGDKTNCKKFYRCVDNGKGSFTMYEFACGEGTVWDSKIEACNHDWAVENCGENSQDINKVESTTSKKEPITQRPTEESSSSSTSVPPQNDDYDVGYGQQKPTTTTGAPKNPESTESHDSTICTSSGFMGDSNDCKKFYRCVDNGKGSYTRYEFSCGEGTVWDPEIEACNHKWAVKDCGSQIDESKPTPEPISTITTEKSDEDDGGHDPHETTSSTTTQDSSSTGITVCTKEGFFGDNQDCKKFYRCVDNQRGGFIKYEFTCGEGTVWDSEIEACNHPSNKKCGVQSSTPQTVEPEHENDEIETTTMKFSKTTQTTQSTEKPQKVEKTCNEEGFFADLENCKMFYRCVDDGRGGYTKYEFTCGEGTIWDQEIQACNHELNNKNCTKQSQSTSKPVVETSTTQQLSTATSTPEIPVSSTSSNNVDECKSEGFYANSKDCKKFYRCVNNGQGGYNKYDFACGQGTIWVQEIQACDHDTDNSCSANENNSQTTQTLGQGNGQTSISPTQSETPEREDDEYPSGNASSSSTNKPSSGKCTAEGFYADENDCRKFYRCVDNGHNGYTKYDFTCGEGTAWDSAIQGCNHEREVETCESTNQSQKPINDEESSTESVTITTASSSTMESGQSSKEDKCEQEGYFGNSEDCKKFYRCVDNGKGGYTKYDYTCGDGTIWDQDVTTCNHPRDVVNPSCESKENNENTGTSSSSSTATQSSPGGSSSTQSGSATEGTTQSSSNCSQENTTKKPENSSISCPKAGFYANPDDCKKFYRCVDWDGDGQRYSVFHFDCGEGTIWDPELETCNYEDSVYPPRDCSSKQSAEVTTSSTEESSTETSSTTQQSTTKEEDNTTTQTTTTESTTEKEKTTTTQKSTTTEKGTTATDGTTTTTEKSTTDQTTTSTEPGTTTTEKTTTEQTTTTTTEQTTTSTEETTTSTEATTTSAEQTTTEQTTTEKSTSTTEQSTTTTDQSTTTTEKQSTTEQETTTTEGTTTENNQESTTQESSTESSSSKECPETDDDQYQYVCPTGFRRHSKYCNLFYQCTEDDDSHEVKVAVFHCPNNTIYDDSKTQCVNESEADKKCDGEMAERRRFKRLDTNSKQSPIVVSRSKRNCPAVGHYPFERNDECSPAFLKCISSKSGRIRGFVYRCPENHVYWSVSRRCEPTSKLRSCKNSDNSWNMRWEIPLETKNIAP